MGGREHARGVHVRRLNPQAGEEEGHDFCVEGVAGLGEAEEGGEGCYIPSDAAGGVVLAVSVSVSAAGRPANVQLDTGGEADAVGCWGGGEEEVVDGGAEGEGEAEEVGAVGGEDWDFHEGKGRLLWWVRGWAGLVLTVQPFRSEEAISWWRNWLGLIYARHICSWRAEGLMHGLLRRGARLWPQQATLAG